MDKTRSAFGYKSELRGRERIILLFLSYGPVVQAHSNHNIVFKCKTLCNVQSLKVLNTNVSCAFMIVLLLSKKRM